VNPKAECHISRQASINARVSGRYPIETVKQAALLTRDERIHIKFENRRQDVISLNQPQGMWAKIAANGIRTQARTNQRKSLA